MGPKTNIQCNPRIIIQTRYCSRIKGTSRYFHKLKTLGNARAIKRTTCSEYTTNEEIKAKNSETEIVVKKSE